MRKIFSAIIGSLISVAAFAGETEVTNESQAPAETVTEETSVLQEGKQGTALDLYLGVDLSGLAVQSQQREIESNKRGYGLGLKGIVSISLEKTVLDFGGGWSRYYQHGKATDRMDGDSTPQDHGYVRTSTGFAEFSARYRVQPTWEAGPLGMVLFGDDSAFSPFPSQKEPNVFIGVSLINSHRGDTGAARWGVNFLTDLTVADRQVFLVVLTGQLGVTLLKSEPRIIETSREIIKTEIKEVAGAPSETRIIPALMLGPIMNFKTADATLTERDYEYIQNVTALLMEHPEAWGNITIDGHADYRGGYELNRKYSTQRAEKVRDTFIKFGLPAERIQTEAHSMTRPIVDRKDAFSLARNRRAEVYIEAVTQPDVLTQKLGLFYKQYITPSTCTVKGCP